MDESLHIIRCVVAEVAMKVWLTQSESNEQQTKMMGKEVEKNEVGMRRISGGEKDAVGMGMLIGG